MKWISVDDFLPGNNLPDDGWVIVRVYDLIDEFFYYLTARYDEGWNIYYQQENNITLIDWNPSQEAIKDALEYNQRLIKVTHWMIPDQIEIKEEKNETQGNL
jgi:hypothetical protein